MTVIIGGRDSILRQIPEEIRTAFPRLSSPLTSEECQMMLSQSLEALGEEKLAGSHVLFCDVVRLILALQLSVSEGKFSSSAIIS